MAGLVKGLVTGQNLALESATAVPDFVAIGATFDQTKATAIVTNLNLLLAELRANGLIKA